MAKSFRVKANSQPEAQALVFSVLIPHHRTYPMNATTPLTPSADLALRDLLTMCAQTGMELRLAPSSSGLTVQSLGKDRVDPVPAVATSTPLMDGETADEPSPVPPTTRPVVPRPHPVAAVLDSAIVAVVKRKNSLALKGLRHELRARVRARHGMGHFSDKQINDRVGVLIRLATAKHQVSGPFGKAVLHALGKQAPSPLQHES